MPRLTPAEADGRQFDFVIVGGGTAGCVLANRLSSDKKHTVLVLEAGDITHQDLEATRVPLFNGKMKNTNVDWKLKSEAQPSADGRSIGVPLGKMLGGSSAFNACLSHRCAPSNFDGWNMPKWSYDQLKQYFRKAETFHDDGFTISEELHGTAGPLHVRQNNQPSLLGSSFKKACRNQGIPEYHDMTDLACQIGVTGIQETVFDGERTSTGSAYLPVDIQENRPNLSIALGCEATRLVVDESTMKVTHVEYKDINNNAYVVTVGREALLSAGAILSPLLLLASGIGSKPELEGLGIRPIADLPGVGKNLQNHWRVPLVHETTRPEMSLHSRVFEKEKESLEMALKEKNGPLVRSWPDAVAYLKVPDSPDNSGSAQNAPQIELFAGGLALCRDLPKLKNVDCASLMMVYIAPFSTGSVTLNTDRSPLIDLGLLSDERDMECIEKGLKVCMAIANEKEYKDSCIKRWIMCPDDQNIRQYIKDNVDTLHHYTGTCKMGPKEDASAVVDEDLKVHGIKGVRVVDASFFPTVPTGQICFPVIACAERASDLILNEYAC